MPTSSPDIAIVGAGIYGCAIAHALAKRRLRVAVLPGAASVYDVNERDGNPVVDRLVPGLYAAWMFSGHGFKFAPAIAERVARAVVEGDDVGVDVFAWKR